MMKKTCIKDFVLNGDMLFIAGLEYNITYNEVDGNIYLYDCWGRYTPVSKRLINENFL